MPYKMAPKRQHVKTVSADFKKNISDNSATSSDFDDSDADKDYVPDDIKNIASNQQVNIFILWVVTILHLIL